MSSTDDYPGIVFDTGSKYCKAGFAGDSFPRSFIPSAVGRFKKGHLFDGFPDIYCGSEALNNKGLSVLTWPVCEGSITNWDEVEKLWHHVFYKELYAAPEEYKMLYAIHPLAPRKEKEMLAEVMFELFNVRAIYIANSPALVLHATGRTTGIVWESGASCAYSAPVFEGFPLRHAIKKSPLNGETMSNIIQKMFAELGYNFTTPNEREIVNKTKASLCYVANNYQEELEIFDSVEGKIARYQLPDGQYILVGSERIKCPETLFKPSIGGLDCLSIVDIIRESVNNCDFDIRQVLYENIVLAGGSTLFKGIETRLKAELLQLKNHIGVAADVEALTMRQFAAWIGGSIIASLSALKESWATCEEYDDVGVEIVHHRFF